MVEQFVHKVQIGSWQQIVLTQKLLHLYAAIRRAIDKSKCKIQCPLKQKGNAERRRSYRKVAPNKTRKSESVQDDHLPRYPYQLTQRTNQNWFWKAHLVHRWKETIR